MNAFLQSPWLRDLGWVLVHSLWQGAILWALLALVFALGRNRLSAATKHRLAWLTLTTLALAPVATMTWMQIHKSDAAPAPEPPLLVASTMATSAQIAPSTTPTSNSDAAPPKPPSTTIPPRPTDSIANTSANASWLAQLPIWFATAWLAGLTLLSIRLLFGWRWIASLKRTGTPPETTWQERFLEWSSRAALRHVRTLICPTLGVPLVVGWLRPVICFPASLLSRLGIAEVEALMLHELAHLKRRDPLFQFWVTVVETLLFHNPAAHALASTVRQTGELACDDLVLEWKGDGKTYARALAAAEEWRGAQFALAATGAGSLKHRIQRIVGLGEHGRLTSLPERFGITSVAGIALYFVVCGLAVPRIARALTPEERISVINQERDALQVTEDNAAPRELKATGTVRTTDGSKPGKNYTIIAWSQNYTVFSTVDATKDRKTITGRGDRMAVGAWIPGYAPAMTPVSFPTPKADRGTFDLVIERGFPAVIKLVDKEGLPVSDAQVSCTVYLAPDRDLYDIYRQGKLTTDATGTCIPGNTLAGQPFRLDVLAYGYQWNRFEDIRFEKGKPTTLTLTKSLPVAGTVVDARTQQPIAGVSALCKGRARDNGALNHGYGYGLMPRMNAAPSDTQGRLELNICHPDDSYRLLLEASGYGRKCVELPSQSGPFKFELEPELVISGTIEDRDKKVIRKDDTVHVGLEQNFTTSGDSVDIPQYQKTDGSGKVSFEFRQLSPGKIKLKIYQAEWETDLSSSMENLRFRHENGVLRCLSVPEKASPLPEPTREVELAFTTPQGNPPFNGEVPLVVAGSSITFHKVIDGVCKVNAPLNSHLNVNSGGITGYRFEHKQLKIEPGNTPLRMDIPMEPAGAISGDLRMYSGYQTGRNTPDLTLLKYEPRAKEWQTVYNDSGHLLKVLDHGSRFFISPVSLNARYRILARHNTSLVETPEFQVDEASPLVRKDIAFPDGDTVSGTVIQPDGTPMEGGNIYLTYKEPAHRITSSNIPLKSDGTFVLQHVNFDVNGQYFLSIPGGSGCAPLAVPLTSAATNLRLQREKGHVVEGRLIGPDDAPVQGAKVHFIPYGEGPSGLRTIFVRTPTADAPSDAEGRFRATTLPPGDFLISFGPDFTWADGIRDALNDPAHRVKTPAKPGQVHQYRIRRQ